MSKPCKHEPPAATCRLCHLYDHDPRYRALWGGPPLLGSTYPGKLARFTPPPCVHLGGPTGALADCRGCAAHGKKAEVLACARHGACTRLYPADAAEADGRRHRLACCVGCPDYQAAAPAPAAGSPRQALALVTLNIGNVLHPRSRASLQAAASRWGADYLEVTTPIAPVGGRPHWQKAFLAEHLAGLGYARAVYYDADVLVRSDCPSLFDATPPGHVGVVTNDQIDGAWWRPGERNRYHPSLAWWAQKLRLPVPPLHHHVNTGMIVFEPAAHADLFARWREAGRSVNWGAPAKLIDQAAFSVLLSALHGDESRTFLPMQFNTLAYRHELLHVRGRMQTFVLHFTGHRKDKIGEAEWDLVPRGSPAKVATAAPPRPTPRTPSATLLGGRDPEGLFGRVVGINLDRRPDRWTAFLEGLPDPWPFREVERFRAIDSERCPPPEWFVHDDGQWGCRQSHLRVIEDALADGVDSLLVFEDDAEFPPDFLPRLREFLAHVPDDWEILFLGGTHTRGHVQVINAHVIGPGYVTLAHAYALRGPALQAVHAHAHLHTPERAEFDHRLGHYASLGTAGAYAPRQWLVHQAAGHSDLTLRHRPRRGVHFREDTAGRALP